MPRLELDLPLADYEDLWLVADHSHGVIKLHVSVLRKLLLDHSQALNELSRRGVVTVDAKPPLRTRSKRRTEQSEG